HIVLPSHGLITNIGKAHLEGFGGIEGVKKGKSELYRYLAQMGGLAFINREEPFLEELAASVDKKIFYRQSDAPTPNEPDHEIVLLREKPFISVAFLDEYQQLIEAHSQLIGLYNFHNITTAVALGKYFKVPASKIKMAIESYHPQNNRSQIINTPKHTIVLDAYNANPTSMEKAMQTFASSAAGTKVAILGDMLELGEASEAEHRKMVELATNLLDQTIFVGPQFSAVLSNGHRYFPSVEALNNWLRENPIAQSSILIKGSRGIQLEKVLTMLAP
ncbi:MAG: Mur ligase family protein, partial [Bacteroidota bacterium]